MKTEITNLIIVLSVIFSQYAYSQNSSGYEGEYFGLVPPVDTPKVFAPDLISTQDIEHSSPIFSPDLKEVYWSVKPLPIEKKIAKRIMFMKRVNDKWTEPQIANFSGKYNDDGPVLSNDGNRLYFHSDRPVTGNGEPSYLNTWEKNNIWYVDRLEQGWGEPVRLRLDTSNQWTVQASISKNNQLYYVSEFKHGKHNHGIYKTENIENGGKIHSILLDTLINSKYMDWCPHVSPNEDYIIFSSDREGSYDKWGDLYICFSNDDNTWCRPINMGKRINSTAQERFPYVSPDGNHFFFTRWTENKHHDIFWVDSKIISQIFIDSLMQRDTFKKKPNIEWITINQDLAFQMGDLWNIGKSNENPVHQVVLSPYQISKYEITNKQYSYFLNQAINNGLIEVQDGDVFSTENNKLLLKLNLNECQIHLTDFGIFKAKQGKYNHPVVCVSWYGATEFAKCYGYRLPTEAEWERAAKGMDNKYPWGNSKPNCDFGNILECNETSTIVGKYILGISHEGCYDMSGNVWEWCSDWLGSYPDTQVTNPTGPCSGIRKIERGGSWPNNEEFIRTTFRGSRNPNEANAYVGFRVTGSQ